jgi:hypothetical protein
MAPGKILRSSNGALGGRNGSLADIADALPNFCFHPKADLGCTTQFHRPLRKQYEPDAIQPHGQVPPASFTMASDALLLGTQNEPLE